jgi:hypothetical protein
MSRSEILLQSIKEFYSTEENSEHLRDILEKRNGISLRNLEWFITNYSKGNNLTYTTDKGKMFTVHCAYKSSLDGYSKKLFDPFCRTEKFGYKIPNSESEVNTTVAQLNFIRWCIKNNIIEYILNNKKKLFSSKKS